MRRCRHIQRILTFTNVKVLTTHADSSHAVPASALDSGPSLGRLVACARIPLCGDPPQSMQEPAAAATQRALEGHHSSCRQKLRDGTTAKPHLRGAEITVSAESALRLLLGAFGVRRRSRRAGGLGRPDAPGPTGATHSGAGFRGHRADRGIGASIVEVFGRDSGHVICFHVPAKVVPWPRSPTASVAPHFSLISPLRIPVGGHAAKRHGGKLDVLVRNAGMTWDRLLVHTDTERWDSDRGVNRLA
jgi:3-oxoacyl-[acyl-carrier protein] reductase